MTAGRRRLGRLLSSVRRCSSASAPAAASLLDWLRKSGGDATGVRVRHSADTGHGLVSAAAVSGGTPLAFLPAHCQLSYSAEALAPPRLRRLIDAVPAELSVARWQLQLALVLLQERSAAETSSFNEYISLLPSTFTVPLFWTGPAVAALQYAPLQSQVARRARLLHAFSRVLAAEASAAEPAFNGMLVDAGGLGWAWAACSSRAFRLRGDQQPGSLLPLFDLCNHSFHPNVAVRPVTGGAAALVTLRDVSAGEELLLCYGAGLSNELLLLDYGFVSDNCPSDSVALRWSLPYVELAREVAGLGAVPFGGGGAEDAPSAAQLAGLAALGLDSAPELLFGASTEDARLLPALRLLYNAGSGGVSAAEAERRALRTAAGMCAVALSQWPGTLAEDEALLGGGGGDGGDAGMTLALRFRVAKKRALQRALAGFRERAAAVND